MRSLGLLAVLAALFVVCPNARATAAVVTVNPSSKTASCDVDTLEAKGVKVAGDQYGVFVQSLIETPQTLTLKFSDVKDQDYDLYINSEFIGTKPGAEIRQGLKIDIPGAVTDPDKMRCLRALEPKVRPEYERMRESRVPEVMRVNFMFGQVVDFIASGLRNDKVFRSADVVIAPSGKILQKMTFMTRHDAPTTAMAVTRACWLIQKARDRIYDVIKDPVLRNSSLVTITPVEFSAAYSRSGSRPHIEATVTNNCDIPVSGVITMSLPSGWKHTARNLAFSDLKPGKTLKVAFDLLPPSKTVTPPETVPIAATVKVIQDPFAAEVKFKIIAK